MWLNLLVAMFMNLVAAAAILMSSFYGSLSGKVTKVLCHSQSRWWN